MDSIFYSPLTYTIISWLAFAVLLVIFIFIMVKLMKIKNLGNVKWAPIIGTGALGITFLAFIAIIELVARHHIKWSRSLDITAMEISYEGDFSTPQDLILVFKEGTIEVDFDEHLKQDKNPELVMIGNGKVLLRSNNSFYPINKTTAKLSALKK